MSESDTMFNERDRSSAAVQLMVSTDPSYDNRTIASSLQMQIWNATNNRNVPRVIKTKLPATVMVFGVVATSHLRSRLESQHQSVPGCAVGWGDPLLQPGGRWQTLGVAAGLSASPQVQRDPGLASEGVLRLCTLLSLDPLLSRPEPTGRLRLVIHREHHQHDLPQHQSQPDRRHPPNIRQAPAGTCGKGMLPVPDPYRGGDWGRRRLHWIDVSSATLSSYLNWFFL